MLGNVSDGYLRAVDEVDQFAALAERGSTQCFERGIDERRLDGVAAGEVQDVVHGFAFAGQQIIAVARGQAQVVGAFSEAHVGIVHAEQDAVFSARGEHAVGLVDAFRYEVVDEYADICFVACQGEGFAAVAVDVGVDACDDALSGCFLVACGAVHLSSQEEVFDFLRFQRMLQLRGVEVVVLDGVAGAVDYQVAEGGNLLQRFQLDVHRQGRGESVQVEFLRGLAFGLQEELVLRLVGEGDDFRLDAGAVARPDALDLPVEKGRIGQAAAQYLVRFLVGVARPAGQLLELSGRGVEEGELVEVRLAVLHFHILVVDAAAVDAHGRAGLHAAVSDAVRGDGFGQFVRSRFGHASAGQHGAAHVHQSVQEGAGGDDDAACVERHAPYCLHAPHFTVLDE